MNERSVLYPALDPLGAIQPTAGVLALTAIATGAPFIFIKVNGKWITESCQLHDGIYVIYSRNAILRQ